MKKLIALFTIFTIILMISSSVVNAQGKNGLVGKKFTVKEANVLFGKVIGLIKVKTVTLRNAVNDADTYVFFTVRNNKAYVMNENKAKRLMADEVFTVDRPLYYFSKSVVEDFLDSISADDVSVEVRASVLTLTADDATLEFALPCPPVCAE